MARTRVLLYSDGYAFSGAERYLLELATGLPKDRFALDAVCAEGPALNPFADALAQTGVEVHRLPRIETLKQRREFLRVLRWFLAHRPSLIHFNLTDPRSCNGAMVAATAALLSHFVTTEHLPQSPFDDKPLPFRTKLAARRTAATIVNCDHHRDLVLSRRTRHGKVVVIPNGIPDSGLKTPARRAAARRAMGLGEDGRILLGWVGRAEPQKDLDLMVEGARRLLPANPETVVLVIGDGPERAAAEAKAAALGISDRMLFLGHRPDARELFYGLDLLVNTSRYEGMPLTISEAMTAEVPVIGPRIAGVQEFVADRASGFLYNQGDGDHLGQILIDACAARESLEALGKVGRERVRTLFSLESMCRKTAEVYEEVLATRAS